MNIKMKKPKLNRDEDTLEKLYKNVIEDRRRSKEMTSSKEKDDQRHQKKKGSHCRSIFLPVNNLMKGEVCGIQTELQETQNFFSR